MTDFWDKIAGVYDLAESINGDVYHEMCAAFPIPVRSVVS